MASKSANLKISHVKSYAAISSGQPSLSTQEKTIVIAGVSNGDVGYAIARSFASSGARYIALVGSTESALVKSKSDLQASYPATKVEYFVTDVKSTESMGVAAHHIRASLGSWDVFVQASSQVPVATTLVGADTDDWWVCFEENVRSTHHFAKHFMPKKRPNATYISLVSRIAREPVTNIKGFSAFATSQSALLKLNEFLAAEHTDLRVFNVDSGRYQMSEENQKRFPEHDSSGSFSEPDEAAELCGDFCVWLASPAQDFLRGRVLCCSWDANELVEKKAEISAGLSLLN